MSEVVYAVHKDGIMISQSTAYRFIERIADNLTLFNSELEKLKAYAQGKEKIEDSDIDEITKPLPEENTFKVSEEIIWNQNPSVNFKVDTTSLLLQMIGTFRFQAYTGLKMLSNEDVSFAPWQEKKYREKANSLGINFFKKILILLFKAEKRAKSTTINPEMLFDLTIIEILALKKSVKLSVGMVIFSYDFILIT